MSSSEAEESEQDSGAESPDTLDSSLARDIASLQEDTAQRAQEITALREEVARIRAAATALGQQSTSPTEDPSAPDHRDESDEIAEPQPEPKRGRRGWRRR